MLKKININIKRGAKIGVAGSWKLSFVAAPIRITDAEGHIIIDDVHIKDSTCKRLDGIYPFSAKALSFSVSR